MCYYLHTPGSVPMPVLLKIKLGLCLGNSDIPEEKDNICFSSYHVAVWRTVYFTCANSGPGRSQCLSQGDVPR